MTGKERYLTWTHAKRDAEILRRKRPSQRARTARPYTCRHCQGFHVGTRTERKIA